MSPGRPLDEELHDAAQAGDAPRVRAALAAGADVASVNEHGRGVLSSAVQGGSLEPLELLLDAGASIAAEPELATMAASKLPLLRYLVDKGMALDVVNRRGAGPLICAVERQPDPNPARYLLDAGVAVDQTDGDGWTALMFAARWDTRWDAIVELLLERGADPNHQTMEGWTPLVLACHSKVVDNGPIQLLVQAPNIDVNVRGTQFGWTPLLKAVSGQYCCDSLVALLLARGADPNIALEVDVTRPYRPKHSTLAKNLFDELKVTKKLDGTTALMWALKKKRAQAARLLCEAGADVHAQTSAGETAESFAKSKPMKALLAEYA